MLVIFSFGPFTSTLSTGGILILLIFCNASGFGSIGGVVAAEKMSDSCWRSCDAFAIGIKNGNAGCGNCSAIVISKAALADKLAEENFGISKFFLIGPLLMLNAGDFILCNFLILCTPRDQQGVNQKS